MIFFWRLSGTNGLARNPLTPAWEASIISCLPAFVDSIKTGRFMYWSERRNPLISFRTLISRTAKSATKTSMGNSARCARAVSQSLASTPSIFQFFINRRNACPIFGSRSNTSIFMVDSTAGRGSLGQVYRQSSR